MKKARHATLVSLAILAIFTLALTFSLEFVARQISPDAAKDTLIEVAPESEEQVHSVNLLDIVSNGARFENYNHVSGRFLRPVEEVENEEGSVVSNRGTYIFIVSSLDIEDENFDEKKASLAHLRGGDNLYHVTFYLPAFHGSAVIYLNSTPIAQIGSISDYHYIDYSSNTTVLREHKDGSEPMYIDLEFDINQRTNSYDNLKNANIITIHYETALDYQAALSQQSALIGTPRAVEGIVENNRLLLLILSILSLISLVFAVIAMFLRDREYFSTFAMATAGFFGVVVTSYLQLNVTSVIYLLDAIQNFSYLLIIIGACNSIPKKIGKLHLKNSLTIPFGVIAIWLTLMPFTNAEFQRVFHYLWKSYFMIAIVLLVVYIILSVYHGYTFRTLFSPTMVIFILLHRMFTFSAYAAILSPMFWISSIIMAYSTYQIIKQVVEIERRNIYLTRNLKAEVQRQTEELKRAIVERENAMRFLSHDLRKPTRTMELLMSTLIAREDDPEQIKTMQIVVQKLGQIESNLSDISRAFKESFVAETSDNIDIASLLKEIYESLMPDCVANGIRLSYYPSPVVAFVKKQALSSVVSNLIINAIEHANCDRIALSLYKKGEHCIITVADNGIGISRANGNDPFGEYQSGEEGDGTHGLGLYICRTYVESMHGTLDYAYTDGELVFTIHLPLA